MDVVRRNLGSSSDCESKEIGRGYRAVKTRKTRLLSSLIMAEMAYGKRGGVRRCFSMSRAGYDDAGLMLSGEGAAENSALNV